MKTPFTAGAATDWEIREYSTFTGGSTFHVYRRAVSDMAWTPASPVFDTLAEADEWLQKQRFVPELLKTYPVDTKVLAFAPLTSTGDTTP